METEGLMHQGVDGGSDNIAMFNKSTLQFQATPAVLVGSNECWLNYLELAIRQSDPCQNNQSKFMNRVHTAIASTWKRPAMSPPPLSLAFPSLFTLSLPRSISSPTFSYPVRPGGSPPYFTVVSTTISTKKCEKVT